ncbi:hypothetical protein KC343_g6168 [Hortaea werneckii]|nr:hypothetical protein KC352_g13108 [Hortaea werneckii]KAI7565430.1 hypothetical protein KC317_g6368 [Hortaea werneckii]KAI7616477.1 hypothetical protein KC346_g5980 [Hortaea werneckii]KAI7626916.1 hypothetical protein KC343_g6168 [Hortaea werneckii]KAI7669709.1 hypothetical protein KC319_g6065 [Hortaea werneckii]
MRCSTHRGRCQSISDASRRRPFRTVAEDFRAFSCQPIRHHERLRLTSTLAVPCTVNRQSNVLRNVIQVPILFIALFDLDSESLNQSLAAKLSRKGRHRLRNIFLQELAAIVPYAASVSMLHTDAHNHWIEETVLTASTAPSLLSGCVSPEHYGTEGDGTSSAPAEAVLLQ